MADETKTVKGSALSMEDIHKRNAEAAAKVKASAPAGIPPGDWGSVQRVVKDLQDRLGKLEAKK